MESFVDTWGDSTSTVKGFLVIKSNTNADDTYCIFEVTGITVQTGWTDITVQNPVGAAPTDNEKIVVEFVRTGDKGDTGNTGPQGDKGGLNYTFSTNTSKADPGAGIFRYNNATVGSVTAIAIDATTTEGTDVSDFIAAWDDSSSTTNYGQIVVKSNTNDDSTYNIFDITGTVTDNTGWLQLTVSGGTGSSIPTDTENCTIEFSRTGDKGDTGNTGPQGDKGGLYYLFDGASQANNPANGDIRFNNATFGSVTTVYIDGLTADSANVESFVDTWGDSTSTVKGFLVIKSNTNADDTYCIFEVTGITVQAGWTDVAVQNPVGAAPTDNEGIVVEFVRTGDKGCLLYTSPSPRDRQKSRMPSSA